MKSILMETVLVGEAIAFWALALPAALVVFPAMDLWASVRAAFVREPAGHGYRRVTA